MPSLRANRENLLVVKTRTVVTYTIYIEQRVIVQVVLKVGVTAPASGGYPSPLPPSRAAGLVCK